ncbi:MAG TPA: hypothetical protein VIM37_02095 [Candidatus Microsaccharimonas sp.]|jgi:hypothetical protein
MMINSPKEPNGILDNDAEASGDIVKPISAQYAAAKVLQLTGQENLHEPHSITDLFEEVVRSSKTKFLRDGVVAAEGSGLEHEQIIRDGYHIVQKILKIVDSIDNDGILRFDFDTYDFFARINHNHALTKGDNHPVSFNKEFTLYNEDLDTGINVSIGIEHLDPSDEMTKEVLDADIPAMTFMDAVKLVTNEGAPMKALSGGSEVKPLDLRNLFIFVRASFITMPVYDEYSERWQIGEIDNDYQDPLEARLDFRINRSKKMVSGSFADETEVGFGALTQMDRWINGSRPYVLKSVSS